MRRATHEKSDTRLIMYVVHSQFDTVVVATRDTGVLLKIMYVKIYNVTQTDSIDMARYRLFSKSVKPELCQQQVMLSAFT